MGLWFNARLIGKCELTQRRVVAVWRRVAHCQQAWFAASARVHPPWAGGARGIVFVCLHRDMVTWSAPFGSVCQEGPVLCEIGTLCSGGRRAPRHSQARKRHAGRFQSCTFCAARRYSAEGLPVAGAICGWRAGAARSSIHRMCPRPVDQPIGRRAWLQRQDTTIVTGNRLPLRAAL